jgi:DNA-binding NtrC family response regulator
MKKILVVDDNKIICSLLTMRLENEGFAVDVVGGGMELLAYLKDSEEPDAVILDLFIPELSGLEALGSITTKWSRAAVFVYSAQTKWKHALSQNPAVCRFFGKNEDMKELVRAIKERLEI